MIRYQITFITPQFSKGSYDDQAEVRPASIRGQLHWWFRALGGKPEVENRIFGSVHGGATASKVVVRVANLRATQATTPTLPHKHGGQASPKVCFSSGASFELQILERLGGLGEDRPAFLQALEAWLLAGSLGLRATRGGGNFRWQPLSEGGLPHPETAADYQTELARRLTGAPMQYALLSRTFTSAEDARRVVTDTIGGRDQPMEEDSLARINLPLGGIGRNAPNGRKTSPLRFRIVKIGASFQILALWDDRMTVTGNRPGDLPAAIKMLAAKGKAIGAMLAGSGLAG